MYLGWSLILLFANSVYMELFTGFAIGFSIHRHQLINHARFVQQPLKWLLVDDNISYKKSFYTVERLRQITKGAQIHFLELNLQILHN